MRETCWSRCDVMPLYEYECDENHHRFEVIQKFSDPPIDKCRVCGSPVHKLFSSPAIQFKGSGFYITDYAKKGSDTSSSAPAGKTGEAKSDSGTGDSAAAKTDTAATTETKSDSGATAPKSTSK